MDTTLFGGGIPQTSEQWVTAALSLFAAFVWAYFRGRHVGHKRGRDSVVKE